MSREVPFEYSSIHKRAPLHMPGDARIALWVGLNIEYFDFLEPLATVRGNVANSPSPSAFGWYQYGLRVGVFRLGEILREHGLRASVLLNSDVCASYPEVIEFGRGHSWVWLGHGVRNALDAQSYGSLEAERAAWTEMVEVITAATGRPPRGWLGPGLSESFETLDLLAGLGLDYVCDWVADDQPFHLKTKTGRMISVPYAVDGLNDIRMRGEAFTGHDYFDLIVDQFDQLYSEGEQHPRVMCIALHPHISGQPFRARNLARALDYVAGHDRVWLATSDEIADWFYDRVPADKEARLEARPDLSVDP
jgi:allantoinase